MQITRFDIPLAVNAAGSGSALSASQATGLIRQIQYTPDPSTPLATGADLVIAAEVSGLPILAVTAIGGAPVVFAPRQPTCSLSGAATTVDDLIAIAAECIKVVVTNGGVSTTGLLSVWVG
jgi:hypothetical protein